MQPLKAARRTALVLAASLVLQQVRVFSADWNSGVGGNAQHSGLSTERGPAKADVLWEGGPESYLGHQAVCDGNILVTTRGLAAGREDSSILVAQDLTTGAVLWTTQLPRDFPESQARSFVKGMRDGRVYAMRTEELFYGYLHALAATNGAGLWRSQDTALLSTTASVVFATNGDLILGDFHHLMRVNATNGARVWRVPRVSPTTDCAEPALSGDRVYVWAQSARGPIVQVHDVATGALLYSSGFVRGGSVQQIGLFLGPDGTVYAPRAQNDPSTDHLIAYEDTGAALVEKWSVPIGYVPFASFGVGPDGSVYSYSRDYRVIRLDPLTGAILNASPVLQPPEFCWTPRIAIDAAGRVFVTTGGCIASGSLVSLDADLRIRWSAPVYAVAHAGPIIGRDGTLVICGADTVVRAYRGGADGPERPCLAVSREGDRLVITFTGRLQSVEELSGAWADVPGAVSPWTVPPEGGQGFFRSVVE